MKSRKDVASLKMHLKGLWALGVGLWVGLCAKGETLTWTGAASGGDATNLLVPANWSPARTPRGGDVLVFNSAVTLAACEFDFGSAGLTISNSAKVVSKTTFRGSGKLIKGGTGTFQNEYVCRHTGGTLILDGEFYQNARFENNASGDQTRYPLGIGQIELRRTATTNPWLNNQNWNYNHAPVLISGPCTADNGVVFKHNNNPKIYGPITAEDDFTYRVIWTSGTTIGGTMEGGISAHGHTVFIDNIGNYASTLSGVVDASLNTVKGNTWLNGVVGTDPDAKLTIGEGTVTMDAATNWKGTDIALTSSSSILAIKSSGNLSAAAELTLATGAKLDLAAGVTLDVAKVSVAGTALAAGTYTASTLSGSIKGSGTLRVGQATETHAAQRITWTGTAGDGLWTTAANWSPAVVPTAGDTAVFTKAATLTACSVYLPAGTLTVDVAQNIEISSYVGFFGFSSFLKSGKGTWLAYKASAYAGGTVIDNGTIGLREKNALGSVGHSVTLDFTTGGVPVLSGKSWDPTFKNKLIIKGPTSSADAIECSNYLALSGPIESDCDISARTDYGPLCFSRGVSAPGHTFTYKGNSSYQTTSTYLDGVFNVALTVTGAWYRSLRCRGVGIDHALQFTGGTNVLSGTFFWEGTNVVVSGSKTVVEVNATANLNEASELRVSNGAKLRFNSTSTLRVGRLFVDGEEKLEGTYTAASLPSVLLGSGALEVSRSFNHWIGGGAGAWSAADNWSLGHVPQNGEVALFTSPVSNAMESVEIGSGDLVLETDGYLNSCVAFTGAGRIIKRGASNMRLSSAKWAHTGGVRLERSVLEVDTPSSLGTGPIEFIRTSELQPGLSYSKAGVNVVLTNDLVVRGPWDGTTALLTLNNDSQINGRITAEGDFMMNNVWSNHKTQGQGTTCKFNVDAAGHTLYLTGCGYQLQGTLNCSINANGNAWDLGFGASFRGTNPDAVLTTARTNTFNATAVWTGTNVVVSGAAATLKLNGAENLSEDCSISLGETGKIAVAKDVKVHVAALKVAGVVQPNGYYRRAGVPTGATAGVVARFVGDGTLVVGPPSGTMVIFR